MAYSFVSFDMVDLAIFWMVWAWFGLFRFGMVCHAILCLSIYQFTTWQDLVNLLGRGGARDKFQPDSYDWTDYDNALLYLMMLSSGWSPSWGFDFEIHRVGRAKEQARKGKYRSFLLLGGKHLIAAVEE